MNIKKVFTEDWCAIYIDDKLVQQGYSVNFSQFVLDLIERGIFDFYEVHEVPTESHYPDDFIDILLEDE